MKTINEPINFFGMNCCKGTYVRADVSGNPEPIAEAPGSAGRLWIPSSGMRDTASVLD